MVQRNPQVAPRPWTRSHPEAFRWAVLLSFWAVGMGVSTGEARGRRPPESVAPAEEASAPVVLWGNRAPRLLTLVSSQGQPCVSLAEVARWTDGQIRWLALSKKAQLAFRGHQVTFGFGSAEVEIDNRVFSMSAPTVKADSALWVPISFLTGSEFSRVSATRLDWRPARNTLWVEPLEGILPPRYVRAEKEGRVVIEMREAYPVEADALGKGRWVYWFKGAPKVTPHRYEVEDEWLKEIHVVWKKGRAGLRLHLSPEASPPRMETSRQGRPTLTIRIHSAKVSEPEAVIHPGPRGRTVSPPPAARTGRRVQRIVIDPGHGGKDPGAMGPRGTEEKSLNLALGLDLAEALRQEGNFEVVLTRTDDRFVPLEERTALANRLKADLFISLHCNASLSSKLTGLEVYILADRPSDAHAEAVARFENAVLGLEKAGRGAQQPVVHSVLSSLTQMDHLNAAAELGAWMEREFSRRVRQPSRGVKQADFSVLRGAAMPALLIEVGFLSNWKEERRLRDRHFQNELVGAMTSAILAYSQGKKEPL